MLKIFLSNNTFYKKIMALSILSFLYILISAPLLSVQATSAYDSGYSHGCSDAGKDSSDKYINQDEKGPSFHTSEFMDGYNAGHSNCDNGGGDSDSSDRSDSDSNSDSDSSDDSSRSRSGSSSSNTFSQGSDGSSQSSESTKLGNQLLCYGAGGILLFSGVPVTDVLALGELARTAKVCP
jgi:hypothetical protein